MVDDLENGWTRPAPDASDRRRGGPAPQSTTGTTPPSNPDPGRFDPFAGRAIRNLALPVDPAQVIAARSRFHHARGRSYVWLGLLIVSVSSVAAWWLLTQVDRGSDSAQSARIAGIAFLILAFGLLPIFALGRLFRMCDEPAVAAIVPFYNAWVLVRIAGLGLGTFLVLMVPVANLFAWMAVSGGLSRARGHGMWYSIGLFFLPALFLTILGLERPLHPDRHG